MILRQKHPHLKAKSASFHDPFVSSIQRSKRPSNFKAIHPSLKAKKPTLFFIFHPIIRVKSSFCSILLPNLKGTKAHILLSQILMLKAHSIQNTSNLNIQLKKS
jgi:hypothetical protein